MAKEIIRYIWILVVMVLSSVFPKVALSQIDSFFDATYDSFRQLRENRMAVSKEVDLHTGYELGTGLTGPEKLDSTEVFIVVRKFSLLGKDQKEMTVLKTWNENTSKFYYFDASDLKSPSVYITDTIRQRLFSLDTFNVEAEFETNLKNIKEIDDIMEAKQQYFIDEQINPYAQATIDAMDKNKNQVIWLTSFLLTSPEYSDIYTGIEVEFYNIYPKAIKYITFRFQGYNRVDDKVGGVEQIKCIGPIEHYESSSYAKEILWLTGIIDYAKIVSVQIQFMDNSMKNFNKGADYFYNDEISEELEKFNTWASKYGRE